MILNITSAKIYLPYWFHFVVWVLVCVWERESECTSVNVWVGGIIIIIIFEPEKYHAEWHYFIFCWFLCFGPLSYIRTHSHVSNTLIKIYAQFNGSFFPFNLFDLNAIVHAVPLLSQLTNQLAIINWIHRYCTNSAIECGKDRNVVVVVVFVIHVCFVSFFCPINMYENKLKSGIFVQLHVEYVVPNFDAGGWTDERWRWPFMCVKRNKRYEITHSYRQ